MSDWQTAIAAALLTGLFGVVTVYVTGWLSNRQQDREGQRDSIRILIDQLQEQVDRAEKKAERAEERIEDLETRVDAQRTVIRAHEDTITELRRENTGLRARLAALEGGC